MPIRAVAQSGKASADGCARRAGLLWEFLLLQQERAKVYGELRVAFSGYLSFQDSSKFQCVTAACSDAMHA